MVTINQTGHSAENYAPFKAQVDNFVVEGAKRGVTVDMDRYNVIMVDRLPENIIGLCVPAERMVLVSRPYWVHADDVHREALISHELGHCVLRRMHLAGVRFNHAISIMYPAINSVDDEMWYMHFRDEYFDELFAPQPPENLFPDSDFNLTQY